MEVVDFTPIRVSIAEGGKASRSEGSGYDPGQIVEVTKLTGTSVAPVDRPAKDAAARAVKSSPAVRHAPVPKVALAPKDDGPVTARDVMGAVTGDLFLDDDGEGEGDASEPAPSSPPPEPEGPELSDDDADFMSGGRVVGEVEEVFTPVLAPPPAPHRYDPTPGRVAPPLAFVPTLDLLDTYAEARRAGRAGGERVPGFGSAIGDLVHAALKSVYPGKNFIRSPNLARHVRGRTFEFIWTGLAVVHEGHARLLVLEVEASPRPNPVAAILLDPQCVSEIVR